MIHTTCDAEGAVAAQDPRSPIPEELLERVARVEDRLHSACAADKEEIAPKLAHLRSAIGEMTELYESRFAEVLRRYEGSVHCWAKSTKIPTCRVRKLGSLCVSPSSASVLCLDSGTPKSYES